MLCKNSEHSRAKINVADSNIQGQRLKHILRIVISKERKHGDNV
jgi:hypothetical protein